MFDLRKAFEPLNGKTFDSFEQCRPELVEIRKAHLKELPPMVGPEMLYDLAVRQGWVKSSGKTISFEITPV